MEKAETECLFYFSLYRLSRIFSPRNPRKSPEQGTYTLGGRGLGQGILKQSRYTSVHGPGWGAPMNAEGAGRCHSKATLDNLWLTVMFGRSAQRLEESKCHFCLQEWGPREIQACRPHLDPWEGDGAANPGDLFQAHEKQAVVSMEFTKGKSSLWAG